MLPAVGQPSGRPWRNAGPVASVCSRPSWSLRTESAVRRRGRPEWRVDLRRDEPYLAYAELAVPLITSNDGDCLARFGCLLDEIPASLTS